MANPTDLPPSATGVLMEESKSLWAIRSRQLIPERGLYEAYLQEQARADSTLDSSVPGEWEPIGPFNQAGRMLALAVDPNAPDVVWAGAATGGLWKLTITGEGQHDYHWDYVDTGLPVLGVRTIAIDPQDSDVIYIGTGEAHFHKDYYVRLLRTMYTYGIGILKTADGGVTWSPSLDWSYHQSRGVLSIEINPLNPDIVFAGTTEGTYRSTDAGQTWHRVHDVIMAMDVLINPQNPDYVFVSCGNAGSPGTGFYRSLDGGDTWEKRMYGLPASWTGKVLMDIFQARPNVLFADVMNAFSYIGLYRSRNNGASWKLVTTEDMGGFMGVYAHYVRVNPVNQFKLFRAEINYGYSTDGGVTWEKFEEEIDGEYAWVVDDTRMHVDHHAFANHPTEPATFFAANDGGVYRTRDGGRTFQDLNRGLVTTQFYPGFASSQADPDLALGGLQDQGTSMFTGDLDWDVYLLGGDGSEAAVNQTDNDIIYLSEVLMSLYKSTNRGEDARFIGPVNFFPFWQDNPNSRMPRGDEVAKLSPFVLLPGDLMYAATNYVYRSTDGGETWAPCNWDQAVTTEAIMSITASENDPDVVYVASRPHFPRGIPPQVMATVDGCLSWTDITDGLPDRDIVVYVSPHDADVVYAAIGGFGTPHLYRSDNSGYSWYDIGQGLPDAPTNAVVVDPDHAGIIYVGNDLGVWASIDDGDTWHPYRMGMPTAAIVIDFNVLENDRTLRAVTHGNGVYERALFSPNEPPVANPGDDFAAECEGLDGAEVALDGRESFDPDGDLLSFIWNGPFGEVSGAQPTVTLPLGLSVITLVVSDGDLSSDPATLQIEVRDTAPPTIFASAEPDLLWPPNNKMVDISLSVVVSDLCDPTPTISLEDVSILDVGKIDPATDIAGVEWGTDDRLISVRAQRAGNGDGRIYIVTCQATDALGNSSQATAEVVVPHDQGMKRGADGRR